MGSEEQMLEELKQIRELLTPKPAPPPPVGFKDDFIGFLSKYKVLGLAVAFIMAIYLGELVKALVDDLVMPIVGYALPDIEWEAYLLGPFRVGHFTGALITFVIVALVVFLLVKLTKRWGLE